MKLTEDELNQLKELKSRIENASYRLGEIEFNKIILNNKRDKILTEVEDIKDEEEVLHKYLSSKYGDINIDLETGNIT